VTEPSCKASPPARGNDYRSIIPRVQAEAARRARILVLYHSASGNTKRMAGLVAEGAAGIPPMRGASRGGGIVGPQTFT